MIQVFNDGYVKLVESWGSDERIIESARMSTNKGFLGWGTPEEPKDEKLLKYLYNNKHMTPFEMAGMIIEVQAPIFVFREWHRHRTQSYNELSARYTALPDSFYIPEISRLIAAKQDSKNKQSSVSGFTNLESQNIQTQLCLSYKTCRELYDKLLSEGVAKEIARLIIPVAQYSRMRASANLRNWLGFLTLRTDIAAQYEIRQYANIVAELIKQQFPQTYSLYIGE